MNSFPVTSNDRLAEALVQVLQQAPDVLELVVVPRQPLGQAAVITGRTLHPCLHAGQVLDGTVQLRAQTGHLWHLGQTCWSLVGVTSEGGEVGLGDVLLLRLAQLRAVQVPARVVAVKVRLLEMRRVGSYSYIDEQPPASRKHLLQTEKKIYFLPFKLLHLCMTKFKCKLFMTLSLLTFLNANTSLLISSSVLTRFSSTGCRWVRSIFMVSFMFGGTPRQAPWVTSRHRWTTMAAAVTLESTEWRGISSMPAHTQTRSGVRFLLLRNITRRGLY